MTTDLTALICPICKARIGFALKVYCTIDATGEQIYDEGLECNYCKRVFNESDLDWPEDV